MKTLTTTLVLLLAVITISAQDITGKWSGTLSVTDGMGQTVELQLNLHITKTDDGYTSTMDSPSQNAFGIPLDTTYYKKPELTVKYADADFVYVGNVKDDTNMEGKITQFGNTHILNMKKEAE